MNQFEGTKLKTVFLIAFVYYQILNNVETRIAKFTKFDCVSYDKPFADFKKCYMKVMARGKIALNMHLILHRVPVDNVTANPAYYVKSSSQRYQPFMYNTTFDFCKFLKNQNSLPFWKIVFSIAKPYTNINHTCPFSHDIIVKNFILDPSAFNIIPFPSGDYMVALRVAAYNDYKAEVRFYFLIKE